MNYKRAQVAVKYLAPAPINHINITISEEAAKAIIAIGWRTGGSPDSTLRGPFQDLADQLEQATGYTKEEMCRLHICDRNTRSSIQFK